MDRQGLRHRCRSIERGVQRIPICGARDHWEDQLKIDPVFSGSDKNDCRLLLTHKLDAVDTRFETSLSLVLCGHTHGGQVVLPFVGPPVLAVKNKVLQWAH